MVEFKIWKTGANILYEISSQVYTTLSRQIRELVSNAVDAKATRFTIRVDHSRREITFEDDGTGMTEEDIHDYYCVLSVSPQAANPDTIGRKGIGKFAIIGINPQFTLETRVKGSEKVFVGRFDYGPTMDPALAEMDLSDLTVCQGASRNATERDPEQFTKVTCKNVADDVLNSFEDEEDCDSLMTELERILPLEYPDEHNALSQLVGTVKARLSDPTLLTIDVNVFCKHYPKGRKLRKGIFGANKQLQPIWGKPDPFEFDLEDHNASVFGYFIDMRKKQDARWQGLVVRVKNVAVREHEFFDWDDKPIMGRLTGEIHIVGIDDQKAITMNRSDFNMSDPVVQEITETVTELLFRFGAKMRRRNQVRVEVRKVMKRMERFHSALNDIEHSWNAHVGLPPAKGTLNCNFAKLKNTDFEDEIRSIDVDGHQVVDVLKFPSPATGPLTDVNVDIDKNGEVEVAVDSALLGKVTYFGSSGNKEEWKYELKKGESGDSPCEIDVNSKAIRLNTSHRLIKDINDQSIRIVVLLYLTYYHYGDNCDTMFEKLLEVLI